MPTRPAIDVTALAWQIADDLFVNGAGVEAERLVLERRRGQYRDDIGGWSKTAVVDRITRVLRAAEGLKA